MTRRKPRNHHRREFCEGDGYGGDGGSLNDEEHGPAVEEAPERAERFAEIDVLTAGVRHGRGEFAVAERADYGHDSRDDPDGEQESGALHLVNDVGGDDEDTGADHRAADDHGGIEEAEAFD